MSPDYQAAWAAIIDRLHSGPAMLSEIREVAAHAAWRVGSGPMLTPHGVSPIALDRLIHTMRDKLSAAGRLEATRHGRHGSTWRLT